MEQHGWERRHVYDLTLRLLHGWNALALLALLASGWSLDAFEHGPAAAAVLQFHLAAGYGLVMGLVARVTWGFVGPRHARLRDLWHPRSWFDILRRPRLPVSYRFGHNEYASLAYLVVYALLATMGITGFALAAIAHDVGPLVALLGTRQVPEELVGAPHEFVATLLALFVAAHLLALVVHERLERNRTALSMLTGVQFRRRADARHG